MSLYTQHKHISNVQHGGEGELDVQFVDFCHSIICLGREQIEERHAGLKVIYFLVALVNHLTRVQTHKPLDVIDVFKNDVRLSLSIRGLQVSYVSISSARWNLSEQEPRSIPDGNTQNTRVESWLNRAVETISPNSLFFFFYMRICVHHLLATERVVFAPIRCETIKTFHAELNGFTSVPRIWAVCQVTQLVSQHFTTYLFFSNLVFLFSSSFPSCKLIKVTNQFTVQWINPHLTPELNDPLGAVFSDCSVMDQLGLTLRYAFQNTFTLLTTVN